MLVYCVFSVALEGLFVYHSFRLLMGLPIIVPSLQLLFSVYLASLAPWMGQGQPLKSLF